MGQGSGTGKCSFRRGKATLNNGMALCDTNVEFLFSSFLLLPCLRPVLDGSSASLAGVQFNVVTLTEFTGLVEFCLGFSSSVYM